MKNHQSVSNYLFPYSLVEFFFGHFIVLRENTHGYGHKIKNKQN